MSLRDFQTELVNGVYAAWAQPNTYNVLMVAPTGAGKTTMFSHIIRERNTAVCAIAHRQELVSQMSLALNRENVPHAIIAPKNIQQQIIRLHHEDHGYSRYSYRADIRVAGVDSLRSYDTKDRWVSQVGLVVQDEGHHLLRENKWGRAQAMFPNAVGLAVTAHALRADGNGLGRHASGLVDRLVLGPSCRDLISRGYLTDYDIYMPDSDIDFSGVKISPVTGDLNAPQLAAVTHNSKQLVGDVVKEYLKRAYGKLGVTFAVDIEEAKKLAAAYNAAGVPAEIITAKTPIGVRGQLMRQFRARTLLQLVSVDCLGEGVDVPAIEVVSLARRTASFQLFAQQLGRALRPMLEGVSINGRPAWDQWGELSDDQRTRCIAASNKPKAIVIDHVGNTTYMAQYHGRPCSRQSYTLDDEPCRSRLRKADGLRTCKNHLCLKPFERILTECPYCHEAVPLPAGGSRTPEAVDGDIILMDPAYLEALRIDVARIDAPPPETFPGPVGGAIRRNHFARQDAQHTLRKAMGVWGGWRLSLGESEREAQKRFYLTYAVDVVAAWALSAADAIALTDKIQDALQLHGVYDLSEPATPPVPV